MSQLLLNKWRKLAGVTAMLVAFLVVGTLDANAQITSAANRVNPHGMTAQSLSITAYNLGTATNVQGGLDAIDGESQVMKPNLDGATPADRLKYAYYQLLITDVRDYSIAVEISLITSLEKAARQVNKQFVTGPMLTSLYNTTKIKFGL